MRISLIGIFILVALFNSSCTKNDLEINGKLFHANGTPVLAQGVHLKTDGVFGKHSRDIGEARTQSGGTFRIFAKSSNNGRYYIFATQKDGSLMQISEVFTAGKNQSTDIGNIIVSW